MALVSWPNPRAIQRAAQARLQPSFYAYYASGADDEYTLADNDLAFQRWLLRPRMLVDVSKVSSAANVMGLGNMAAPIIIAPMAMQVRFLMRQNYHINAVNIHICIVNIIKDKT